MGWGPSLILLGGSFIVLTIIAAFISDWIKANQKRRRRNKRLYGHGNIYSLRDFHDRD